MNVLVLVAACIVASSSLVAGVTSDDGKTGDAKSRTNKHSKVVMADKIYRVIESNCKVEAVQGALDSPYALPLSDFVNVPPTDERFVSLLQGPRRV